MASREFPGLRHVHCLIAWWHRATPPTATIAARNRGPYSAISCRRSESAPGDRRWIRTRADECQPVCRVIPQTRAETSGYDAPRIQGSPDEELTREAASNTLSWYPRASLEAETFRWKACPESLGGEPDRGPSPPGPSGL